MRLTYLVIPFTYLILVTPTKAEKLTIISIYEKFNMRSVYSSFGQRLKHYCESYPKDYFKKENSKFIGENRLELSQGEDVWVILLGENNKVSLNNQIKNGTYNSTEEYLLTYDVDNGDWRADETYIKATSNCVTYNKIN